MSIMREIISVIILSIIVEKCVGIIKDFRKQKISPALIRTLSLILSIILTITAKIGMLQILKILPETVNAIGVYIDYIITGIIISRGSNVVHDLFSIIEKLNKNFGGKK